jgi:RND family efflux transporter MFP subunit
MSHLICTRTAAILALLAIALGSCRGEPAMPHDHAAPAAQGVTNRIPLQTAQVADLGIVFATAERGRLTEWLRVPGQLEARSDRRWHLNAPAEGRVIAVGTRWQRVAAGDVIAELESPQLREAQESLLVATAALERSASVATRSRERLAEGERQWIAAKTLEAACRRREAELLALVGEGRSLGQKELLESQRASVDAARAALDAAVLRDDLERRAADAELELGRAALERDRRREELAALSGRNLLELGDASDATAAWRSLDTITVRAPATGVIVASTAAPGAWVERGAALAELVDLSQLRFVGILPESDLARLPADAAVEIALATAPGEVVTARLLGPAPAVDPTTRTICVEAELENPAMRWLDGGAATAQILLGTSQSEEVLVPASCVVEDGAERIVFVRDPANAAQVIRTPVELGRRSRDRVEILAGVLAGDVLVARGARPLAQSGKGKAPEGGHFHADGTWHAGDK